MNDYENRDFASPFAPEPEQPEPEPMEPEQPEQPNFILREPEQPYTQQPYTQAHMSPYAQQPYTQAQSPHQPYNQVQPPPPAQAYVHPGQGYAPPGQVYGQPGQAPPPRQLYGSSPYSQFAQAQYGQQPSPPPSKRKKEKERKERPPGSGIGRKNMAVLVVVIIVACVVSGIGGGIIGAGMNPGQIITMDGGTVVTIEPSYDITTTEAVAKKALSSVVGITATGRYGMGSLPFGFGEREVSGVGTGMIIDANGYILTNSHVVMDGSVDAIDILLSDGDEIPGTLVWSDAGLDLAVVKVEARGLAPVELGDSGAVLIGSYVAAIGNPLGLEFSGSVTSGVVSGLDRTITVADGMGGYTRMQGLIQVDAVINQGNSGGPLLNNRGQVIGINTAKADAEGMGFAIPINTAIPIVEKVIRDGSFERVFMGVSAADVGVIRDNYPNVELMVDSGACITDVAPASPAERGGLMVKDVITAIDGNEIDGSDSLIKLLLGYSSGDTITVVFDRDGEAMEAEVTLVSQSELERIQQEVNPFREPERGNAGR
ncbi:MAG: trypsin-like peptidase domain-containing protein [Clostridiales bacterium]|nr:trypsin-like peptidase domain-containing protein [Clostridiales bacterium]